MTQTLEQLSRQRLTLTSIRGIVRTMKTLAAINTGPYEQAAQAIADWQQTVRQGFLSLAWQLGRNPLGPSRSSPSQQVLVAFGSDHGFCGNYNELLAEEVRAFCLREGQLLAPVLFCVGSKLRDALAERSLPSRQLLLPPASADGIGRLAGELVTLIEQASQGQPLTQLTVDLAFTRRAEHGRRVPVVTRLLPLDPALLQPPSRWPSRALPSLHTSAAQLLPALIRNHIFASVFQASAEAMATENAARLALMQQAEQAVDERLELVKRQMSTVRQNEVTTELMDIIIGHSPDLEQR